LDRGSFGKVGLLPPERWMGSQHPCEEMCSHGCRRTGSIWRHPSPQLWFIWNRWAFPTSGFMSRRTKGLVIRSSLCSCSPSRPYPKLDAGAVPEGASQAVTSPRVRTQPALLCCLLFHVFIESPMGQRLCFCVLLVQHLLQQGLRVSKMS